jgi:hypothetical protein
VSWHHSHTCGTEFSFWASKLGQVDLDGDVVILQRQMNGLVGLMVGALKTGNRLK